MTLSFSLEILKKTQPVVFLSDVFVLFISFLKKNSFKPTNRTLQYIKVIALETEPTTVEQSIIVFLKQSFIHIYGFLLRGEKRY